MFSLEKPSIYSYLPNLNLAVRFVFYFFVLLTCFCPIVRGQCQDADQDQIITRALMCGDYCQLEKFIQDGTFASNKKGYSLLTAFAACGSNRQVLDLLQKGADPDGFASRADKIVREGRCEHLTPLTIAILNDHQDTAEILLKNGARVNFAMYYRGSPMNCIQNRKAGELLLKYGGTMEDVNLSTTSRRSAEVFDFYFNHGVNPCDVKTIDEILGTSCRANYMELIPVLFKYKMDANSNFIRIAMGSGKMDIVGALVSDPEKYTWQQLNFPPLIYYGLWGDVEKVRQILSEGCHPNTTLALESFSALSRNTPLLPLLCYGNPASTQMMSNWLTIAGMLLEKGAKVNEPVIHGAWEWFPLELAVNSGNEKMARLLLAHSADPNIDSRSILYNAVNQNNVGMVKCLLEFKADPLKKDPFSRLTAIELAKERGNEEILNLLYRATGNR